MKVVQGTGCAIQGINPVRALSVHFSWDLAELWEEAARQVGVQFSVIHGLFPRHTEQF